MIDLQNETVVTLVEATNFLPRRRRGRKVHISTLYRWTQRGFRGVKLETLRLGGGLVTSIEALQRFAERLSAPEGSAKARSDVQRRRDNEQAARELDRIGI